MTIESDFYIWLKGYFPEADTSKRNGEFINTQTKYLWEGWVAGYCKCQDKWEEHEYMTYVEPTLEKT